MRFVPDGPLIPNSLIRKWRDGKVLFLAGAGVSKPAGLPLFKGLALDIYRHLNDGVLAALTAGRDGGRRERMLGNSALSARQKIEAELFLDNQLDRLFAAMEARLDQDRNGLVTQRRVRGALETVLRHAATFAQGHRDLLRLSVPPGSVHAARGALCRLATTNFDLLFEQAWSAEFGTPPRAYDARLAPRPGASDFAGIIHLHGMLNADAGIPGQFVLSSRDFARVYLRSGVVANYIYDLMRRYTIVLIGYSADDPPMRYLMDAIGEDAALFEDMNDPYVIADRGSVVHDPNGELEVTRWKSKNIIPMLFRERAGADGFAPLWETLHAWAEWARGDAGWVAGQLADKTRNPYGSSPAFAADFVQDLLSLLDQDELESAICGLRANGVEFGWIEALEGSLRSSAP
jgi:SIR2-like domain